MKTNKLWIMIVVLITTGLVACTKDPDIPVGQVFNVSINISANPIHGGTVSGGGFYQSGQSCTVTATANTNYAFAYWTANGVMLSSETNYTFTVSNNCTLVGHFVALPPQGAINGRFTINANGGKVYFSQGNLQYQSSTNTWRFAPNQYDCIGYDNSNISSFYSGWIDLFGWGTSNYNHGAICYQPWDTSSNYCDYYAYGSWYNNLNYENGMADWGYNVISNGGNNTGIWRTLTKNEWSFVLNSRNTVTGIRFAKAQVSGKNGIVLMPDDWSDTTFSFNNPNDDKAAFNDNVISSFEWNTLETSGTVFLPVAGSRKNNSVSGVEASGYYWSSSCYNEYYAGFLHFNNSSLSTYQNDFRYYGQSVRVVCAANY